MVVIDNLYTHKLLMAQDLEGTLLESWLSFKNPEYLACPPSHGLPPFFLSLIPITSDYA